jgi:hypothetical protein
MAIVAIVGVACIDMSAPKGPASISILLLPSPSVVAGDVMRDSNGAPAPLTLVAYDGNGAPVGGLTSQFFTDSVRYAHLNSSNVLTGDSIGISHIVGQIGSLQTDVTPVPVTASPDTFFVSARPDTLFASLGVDSSSSLGIAPLGVSLRSAAQSAVTGFVVKYVLKSAPAASATATSPAVFLIGDNSKISLTDTTDVSGNASRSLIVNVRNLGDLALIAGTKIDSAVVQAFTSYKGVPVKGSPVTFTVLIRIK